MLRIKKNPYQLLLLTAIGLLIVLSPLARLDFQDVTVFGASLNVVVWIIPFLLASFWFLYLLTRKFLFSSTITWIHILITVFSTILIVVILYIGINPSPTISEIRVDLIGTSLQILFLFFVAAQLAYLANVLCGLFANTR